MIYFTFQRYLESLPPPIGPSINIDSGPADTSDGSAPSYPESALSESIPSTPEVAFDSNPPRFPRVGETNEDGTAQWPLPRKLSHDSGLCELDSDESVAPPSGSHKSHHQGATGLMSLHLRASGENSGKKEIVSLSVSPNGEDSGAAVTIPTLTRPMPEAEIPTAPQDGNTATPIATTTDATPTTDRLINNVALS